MATISSYPNGTTISDWTPTPVPAPSTSHHLNLDEPYPPGDSSDYVAVAGYSGGLIEEFTYPNDTTNLDRLDYIDLVFYLQAAVVTDYPVIQVDLIVGPIIRASKTVSVLSASWGEKTLRLGPLNIDAETWAVGPRKIRITPRPGGTQYKDMEES